MLVSALAKMDGLVKWGVHAQFIIYLDYLLCTSAISSDT